MFRSYLEIQRKKLTKPKHLQLLLQEIAKEEACMKRKQRLSSFAGCKESSKRKNFRILAKPRTTSTNAIENIEMASLSSKRQVSQTLAKDSEDMNVATNTSNEVLALSKDAIALSERSCDSKDNSAPSERSCDSKDNSAPSERSCDSKDNSAPSERSCASKDNSDTSEISISPKNIPASSENLITHEENRALSEKSNLSKELPQSSEASPDSQDMVMPPEISFTFLDMSLPSKTPFVSSENLEPPESQLSPKEMPASTEEVSSPPVSSEEVPVLADTVENSKESQGLDIAKDTVDDRHDSASPSECSASVGSFSKIPLVPFLTPNMNLENIFRLSWDMPSPRSHVTLNYGRKYPSMIPIVSMRDFLRPGEYRKGETCENGYFMSRGKESALQEAGNSAAVVAEPGKIGASIDCGIGEPEHINQPNSNLTNGIEYDWIDVEKALYTEYCQKLKAVSEETAFSENSGDTFAENIRVTPQSVNYKRHNPQLKTQQQNIISDEQVFTRVDVPETKMPNRGKQGHIETSTSPKSFSRISSDSEANWNAYKGGIVNRSKSLDESYQNFVKNLKFDVPFFLKYGFSESICPSQMTQESQQSPVKVNPFASYQPYKPKTTSEFVLKEKCSNPSDDIETQIGALNSECPTTTVLPPKRDQGVTASPSRADKSSETVRLPTTAKSRQMFASISNRTGNNDSKNNMNAKNLQKQTSSKKANETAGPSGVRKTVQIVDKFTWRNNRRSELAKQSLARKTESRESKTTIQLTPKMNKNFQFYCRQKNCLKTGVVITKQRSSSWFEKAGLLSNDVDEENANQVFDEVAGMKLVMNIHDYLKYLSKISRISKLTPQQLVERLGNCPPAEKSGNAKHKAKKDKPRGLFQPPAPDRRFIYSNLPEYTCSLPSLFPRSKASRF